MSHDEMDIEFDILDENEDDDEEDDDDDEEGKELMNPFRRTGHICIKWQKDIIIWGGYTYVKDIDRIQFHSSKVIWVYNPIVDKWSCRRTKGPAPVGRSGASGLLHNHYLYIYGGYTIPKYDTLRTSNRVYSLNLINLTWTKHKIAGYHPLPCDKMVGWLHQSRLYYFGGFGYLDRNHGIKSKKLYDSCYDVTVPGKGWTNQLVAYDINSSSWIWPPFQGVPPEPRAAHACVKVHNKVYIFGGRHREFRLNDLHCLDLDTMTWSGKLITRGDIPTGRSWHSLTQVSDNHVVLYGGLSNQREALTDCWLLNLNELSWEKITLPFRKSRVWHTACANDPGEVLIFGGCTGNILNPIMPPEAKGVITLWFSPKSLLRSCLDVIVHNKQQLEPYWLFLPASLSDVLRLKSSKTSEFSYESDFNATDTS